MLLAHPSRKLPFPARTLAGLIMVVVHRNGRVIVYYSCLSPILGALCSSIQGVWLLIHPVPFPEVGVLYWSGSRIFSSLSLYLKCSFFLGLCSNVDWICYFPINWRLWVEITEEDLGQELLSPTASVAHFSPQMNNMRKTFLVPCYAPDHSHNHSISSLGKNLKATVNSHCEYSSRGFYFLTVATVRLWKFFN